MRRIGITGSVVVAGALLAVFLTKRDGPQPKGPLCTGLAAKCERDGGPVYPMFLISHDTADANFVEPLLDQVEAQGCTLYEAREVDAGYCAAQPNAVRRFDPEQSPPWPCRCRTDAGWRRIPCGTLAQDYRLTETFGCDPGANAEDVP